MENNISKNCTVDALNDINCRLRHPNKYHVFPLWLIIGLMVLIHIVGFFGNSVVVYIVINKRRMQSYTNWMLFNLSVSDLFVVLFCIPLDIPLLVMEKWIYGKIFCSLYYPIGTATLLSSAFTLVPIAFSRYWGITQPFGKQASVPFAKVSIILIWTFSLILVTPLVIALTYNNDHKICYESWKPISRRIYTVTIFLVGYALPLIINTVAYGFVVNEVSWKVGKKPALPYKDLCRIKENRSLMKLSLIVTITFALCVLPNHIVLFWAEFGNFNLYKHHVDVRVGAHLLLFLNSALNPIIYNVFSETFREGFKEILRGEFRSSSRRKSERALSNTLSIPLRYMDRGDSLKSDKSESP